MVCVHVCVVQEACYFGAGGVFASVFGEGASADVEV